MATIEEVLNRLFQSHHELGRNTRFAITLRVLPAFAAESQLTIAYALDSKATATLVTLSKPVNRTLNDLAAMGKRPDVAEALSLIHQETKVLALNPDLAKKWLAEFWKSISAFARTGPAVALKHDGTQIVTITLDATTYQIFYSDVDTNLTLDLQGPDPDWSGDLSRLDPVMRWAVSIHRQILAMAAGKPGIR